MTPWQRAKAWHDANVTDETFEETLGWHLTHGLVYSTPEVFLLARQVYWDAALEDFTDDGEPNAWFVELAASAGCANPAGSLCVWRLVRSNGRFGADTTVLKYAPTVGRNLARK